MTARGLEAIPCRQLGSTGPDLTRIGLGTWAIGGPWRFGWGRVDDEESIAAIRHAIASGVNWVDTAPIYGLGHAEEVVGRALDGYAVGEDVFVATKCGRRSEPDGSIVSDLRPDSIRSECERSLRRLGVERLDLYQIHWPDLDSGTPLEESWSVLATLVDEGKVRWLGVSNFDVDQLDRCERIRHVDSLQPPLSILRQSALRTTISWAVEHQTGVVVYSPMASGLLTGTFDRTRLASLPLDDVRLGKSEFCEPEFSRNLAVVDRLRGTARELGAGVADLAVAWALAQEGVTAAIVGARRPQQIEEWLGGARLTLPDEVLTAIDQAVAETRSGSDDPPALPASASAAARDEAGQL
jgi:aryl-alcohol dehydrogenase-like predicted oxidoreductase